MLLSRTSAHTTLLQQAQVPLGFTSLQSTVRHSLFLSSQNTGRVVVAADRVKREVVSLRDCVQGKSDSPAVPRCAMMGQIWKQKHSLHVYRGLENKQAS